MKKNNIIRVEGIKNDRRIVREVIDKHVDKGVMAKIDFVPIMGFDVDEHGNVTNTRIEQHDYAVDYEFKSGKSVFDKIIKELEFIGLRLRKDNRRAYTVIFDY